MRVALNGLFLDEPATGTGQYLRELVQAMRQLTDDELILVAAHSDPTAPAPVHVAKPHFSSPNFQKIEFEHLTFPRYVWRHGFDLAHVPHFGPPFFPSIPTVITIHDLIPLIVPLYRGSPLVRLYSHLAAMGARRAGAILADSVASARDTQSRLNIPGEKIHTVYLAANASYQPICDPHEIQRVRTKYQLPEQFVLYLGGFDARKNVRCIIRAFAVLAEERAKGWKLVLAGKLPEANSGFMPDPRVLAREAGLEDSVQLTGFIAEEDKPALYSAARAFLFPSVYEGFGLPPLEAMACGTPVLVAERSSLPEVVGDAGWLLDPNDPREWANALRVIISDATKWGELRERGLAQAKRFSWERTARETLRVYDQVCQ